MDRRVTEEEEGGGAAPGLTECSLADAREEVAWWEGSRAEGEVLFCEIVMRK